MSVHLADVLRWARPSLSVDEARAASQLSDDPEARLVADRPSVEKVCELLPTLETRARNATCAGIQVVGLNKLINELKNMRGQELVEGYGVVSSIFGAKFYFVKDQRKLLGAAMVKRKRN